MAITDLDQQMASLSTEPANVVPLEEQPVSTENTQVADLRVNMGEGPSAIPHSHENTLRALKKFAAPSQGEGDDTTQEIDLLDDAIQYGKRYLSNTGTYYERLGKSFVMGASKDFIFAIPEVAGLAAEYGLIRAPSAVSRTIEEGIRGISKLAVPDAYEKYVGEAIFNDPDFFEYKPILDQQDEIDNFLKHQIPALLQAGLDFAGIDKDVKEFPGAYKKFVDHIHAAYEIPEDQRSIETDFTRLFFSIITPYMGARRVLGKDSPEMIQSSWLKAKKQMAKMKDELSDLVIKREKATGKTIIFKKGKIDKKGQPIPKALDPDALKEIKKSGGKFLSFKNKGVPIADRRREVALRKGIVEQGQKLAGFSIKSRHLGRAMAAIPLLKRITKGVKTELTDEALVATIAAGTMVTTENLLKGTELEEYAKLSFIPALVVAPFAPSIIKGSAESISQLVHLGRAHIEGALHGNTTAARYHILRSKKYSAEQIRKMDENTQIQLALLDKRDMKNAQAFGEYLQTLRKSGREEDKAMYEDIVSAISFSMESARRLSKNLREDVEKGVLDGKDVQGLADQFPILIDQVAILSGLSYARQQLVKGMESGGFARKKRVLMINDLDRMQNIIEEQTAGIVLSMKGIQNKIKKQLGIDETEESVVGILYENLENELRRVQEGGKLIKDRVEKLSKLQLKDVDAANNAEVRRATDNLFGEDETNAITHLNRGIKSPERAEELASIAKINMGNDMKAELNASVGRINAIVKSKYEDAFKEDILLPTDTLLANHADFLEGNIDSVSIFKPVLRKMQNQENRLVFIARHRGLENLKRNMSDSEYYDALLAMHAKFDSKLGETNETTLDFITQNRQDFDADPKETIRQLEISLLKRPFFMVDEQGVKRVIKNVNEDGIEDMIIPTALNASEIHLMRREIMTSYYGKRARNEIDYAKANFAIQFDDAIEDMFDSLAKQEKDVKNVFGVPIKIALEQRQKIKDANTFYKNTMGKTYKQRLGQTLRNHSRETGGAAQIDFIDPDELFDPFIKNDGSGHNQKAEQFAIMFSELDPKTGKPIPNTIRPEAIALLKQALRRYMVKGEGNELGLKSLSNSFVSNFLTDSPRYTTRKSIFTGSPETSINILRDANKEDKELFFSARNNEKTYDFGKLPFKEHSDELNTLFKELGEDKRIALERSLLGSVQKTVGNPSRLADIFIKKKIFEAETAYHYGRESLDVYKKRYEESGKPEDLETFLRLQEQERVVQSKRTAETLDAAGVPEELADDVLELVGPRILETSKAKGKSPIEITLEIFEDNPEQQERVRLALKGMFTEYIAENAFNFTDTKTLRTVVADAPLKFRVQKQNEIRGAISLSQTVKIEDFAEVLNKNQKSLEILWADDPEQLERIKRIYQIGVITKGKPAVMSGIGEIVSETKPGAVISRLYGISRGVISPRYVATEMAVKRAQLMNSTHLLQTIMKPSTTKVVDEILKDVKSGNITDDSVAKTRDLAITLFYLNMGDDDPRTIRDEGWIRDKLDTLARRLRGSDIEGMEGEEVPFVPSIPNNTPSNTLPNVIPLD